VVSAVFGIENAIPVFKKCQIPVLAGIEVFSRNIPIPLKKKWPIGLSE
jgi:hypothetical protein